METVTQEFEIEIGKIRYSGEIQFWYYAGTYSIDPTEGEDTELKDWEFDGPIHAWDMEEETEYFVKDEKEVEMVKDWICIEDLFSEAIS